MADPTPRTAAPPRRARALIALAFALAAFIHASLWAQIIPPWQVPDEIAHFEYVHLLTRLGRRPTPADADPAVQAQILRSMWQNRFWEYLNLRRPEQPPSRFVSGGVVSGGAIPDTQVVGDAFVGVYSQLANPTPVYYALLAPVQALVMDQPIDDQLRALRLASRVIFALGVLFIVLTAGELLAWRWSAVIGAGLFSVLQPMFVYIGSGVNNDNGVMLFISALAWQVARGWRRGFSWPRLVLMLALVILAIYAKRTAVFLVAWLPLVLGVRMALGMSPVARRRALLAGVGGLVALSVIAVALYFIPGPTPANWRSSSPWQATWTTEETVEGRRAFALRNVMIAASLKRPYGLADGQQLTLQGWFKGAAGEIIISDEVGSLITHTLSPTPDWEQFSINFQLAPESPRLRVSLRSAAVDGALYLDALRLRAQDQAFVPLPNPSAEIARPALAELMLTIAEPLGMYGQAVRFINDYRANLAALPVRLPEAIAFIQKTYWGAFSLMNPSIHIGWVTVLAMLVGAALSNAIRLALERRPDSATATLLGLWLVGGLLLLLQTLAPLLSFATEMTWLPQGRYLFGGMALLAPVMSLPATNRPAYAGIVAAIFAILTVALASECAAYFS